MPANAGTIGTNTSGDNDAYQQISSMADALTVASGYIPPNRHKHNLPLAERFNDPANLPIDAGVLDQWALKLFFLDSGTVRLLKLTV